MNRKYRRTIIAGNWKMNMLASGVRQFADEMRLINGSFGKWCDLVLCVPYTAINASMRAFKGFRTAIGAQNLSEHVSGAYTGEVAGVQLRDIGVQYVIIGHSERRNGFGETDEVVAKKIRAALEASLRPILCVGETQHQREMGVTAEVVALQIKSALSVISAERVRRVVVAYEPIWAIGTGKTATPDDAAAVCREIRAVLREMYGARTARAISILYGGSMNAENAFELLAQPDIDGGLIGGASLDPASLTAIINAANQP